MIYGYSTSLQYSSDTEIFSIIISRFSVFLRKRQKNVLPKKEEHKIAWQKLLIVLIRNNLLIGNST